MARVSRFNLQVQVIQIGSGYVGACQLAGVKLRGNRQPSAAGAAMDLFRQLHNENNLEAMLAVDLASVGEDASVFDVLDDFDPEAINGPLPEGGTLPPAL